MRIAIAMFAGRACCGRGQASVVFAATGAPVIERTQLLQGLCTQFRADFESAVLALDIAIEQKATHLHVFGDCLQTVAALRGEALLSDPASRDMLGRALDMASSFDRFSAQPIPREQNCARRLHLQEVQHV